MTRSVVSKLKTPDIRRVFSGGVNNVISSKDTGVGVKEAASVIVDYYFVLSLVLGGCCANVWAYEMLLNQNPRIGSALTFSQMLFITIQTFPSFLTFTSSRSPSYLSIPIPHLKPRQVPIYQWALQVIVLTTGSLLNNWAFAFEVPLTVQIVFRSGGLGVSMIFGYLVLKKRYTVVQVTSVLLVSIGVVLATLARPSVPRTDESPQDIRKYVTGVAMLVISLFLTGLLGLMQERTYRRYGPCWREGVFYTHFLSLPIFLFLVKDIKQGLGSLTTKSNLGTTPNPHAILILCANLVSQLICVSAVNRLSSQVSSVSTNLVLTTRKAISLCFSVWWFGNGWNLQLGLGAGMVFAGSLLFTAQVETIDGAPGDTDKQKPKKKKE